MPNNDTRSRMYHHAVIATWFIIGIAILSFVAPGNLRSSPNKVVSTSGSVQAKQRAMQANEQLRTYRHRIELAKKNSDAHGIDGASRTEVGITIDRQAATSSTIFFADDMEAGVNAWSSEVYSGSDLWHQSELLSSSSSMSWWAGVAGQTHYRNGSRVNNALLTPAINLAGGSGPVTLLFAENFVTETGWDYCQVDVMPVGGTAWTHLRGGYGVAPSGDSHGWQVTELDLSAFSGQSVVLRFYFDTGDEQYNEFPGWFIDDVVIFDQGGRITGKKFFDVNNDGIKTPGERGIKDWYITAVGPITVTTKTNYRGRYGMTLPLGNYAVLEGTRPNWTQTYPPGGQWNLNLSTPDTLVDSVHFGNYSPASFINGIKFNDLDRNGANNGADTALGEWKIVLEDTAGNQIDFDRTDSLGAYSLYVFTPGRYVVREATKTGWIQSAPATESYIIDIPDLATTSNGNDFGNYRTDSANSLLGQKFNDHDRSGTKNPGEVGVAGIKIQLQRKGTGNNYSNFRKTTTDSSGYYQFLSLPADTYRVAELPSQGWWQSFPESSWGLILNSGGFHDDVDFGNYEIAPGSIGGMKFHDVDGNGAKDGGDAGLSGWHIILTGSTYFNSSVIQSLYTNGSGTYDFASVWPGNYTVSEVWRTGWTQTYPLNLGVHHIILGPEELRSGVEFGNIDSVLGYSSWRTFKPESLALAVDRKLKHKPVQNTPDRVQFWITFRNDTPDSAVGMKAHLGVPYIDGSLTTVPAGTITPLGDKFRVIEILFSTAVQPGDSVMLCGFGRKPKPQFVDKWFWKFNDSTVRQSVYTVTNELRHPMPNAINLVQAVGAGLKVGLGGPHTVVHPSWKDVMKSLVEKADRMHLGEARCLDRFAGSSPKSIKKQQKNLPPKKHNNKLFAEAIALQVNILGSDFGYLHPGFGNLIFDDGTGAANPLNGLAIREVAAKLDSFMSSFKDTVGEMECKLPPTWASLGPNTSATFESLYVKIRMINCSFDGPIDTVSFATGLQFKGTKQLSEVPFLRYDPTNVPRSFVAVPPVANDIPDEFSLNQNYPNPFNPTTTVSFVLAEPSLVTLRVYNILGQEVSTLLNRESLEDGEQEVEFDASNLPSGLYFYTLSAQTIVDDDEGALGSVHTAVRKMLLVK